MARVATLWPMGIASRTVDALAGQRRAGSEVGAGDDDAVAGVEAQGERGGQGGGSHGSASVARPAGGLTREDP